MARRRRGAFPVVDLDEQSHVGQPVAHPGHAVTQRRMEHEHLCVAVVHEVHELVVEVPVVDVDRHGAMLERAVLRDEVLGTVEHVEGNLADFVDSAASIAEAKRAAASSKAR